VVNIHQFHHALDFWICADDQQTCCQPLLDVGVPDKITSFWKWQRMLKIYTEIDLLRNPGDPAVQLTRGFVLNCGIPISYLFLNSKVASLLGIE